MLQRFGNLLLDPLDVVCVSIRRADAEGESFPSSEVHLREHRLLHTDAASAELVIAAVMAGSSSPGPTTRSPAA